LSDLLSASVPSWAMSTYTACGAANPGCRRLSAGVSRTLRFLAVGGVAVGPLPLIRRSRRS
jgi:hypothetical protein